MSKRSEQASSTAPRLAVWAEVRTRVPKDLRRPMAQSVRCTAACVGPEIGSSKIAPVSIGEKGSPLGLQTNNDPSQQWRSSM